MFVDGLGGRLGGLVREPAGGRLHEYTCMHCACMCVCVCVCVSVRACMCMCMNAPMFFRHAGMQGEDDGQCKLRTVSTCVHAYVSSFIYGMLVCSCPKLRTCKGGQSNIPLRFF